MTIEKGPAIVDSALIHKLEFCAGTTNNNILTDQERSLVRILTSDVEWQLSYWDQEIMKLVAKREEVAARLSRFRIAMAPHKRLPPEILANIFVCAMGTDQVNFPRDTSQLPWVLLKVCSTWRHVALNDRRLWDRITIKNDLRPADLACVVEQASALITSLPPAVPLSVCLLDAKESSSHTYMDAVIIPNLERIVDLKLAIPMYAFWHLLKAPANSLRSLSTFYLNIRAPGHHIDGQRMQQIPGTAIFQQAVNLRTVTLRSYPGVQLGGPSALLRLSFPWKQLTCLCLIDLLPLTPVDVHQILRECIRLQMFRVAFAYRVDEEINWNELEEPLHLPELDHVELDGEIPHPYSLASLGLPWEQLTILQLRRFDIKTMGSSLHHILHKCLRLEALFLRCPQNQLADLPEEHLLLPRLRHLEMFMADTLILDKFNMPALSSIQIDSDVLPFPATSLANMVVRSKCSISSLIYNAPILPFSDYTALLQLLSLIPAVHKLNLGNLVLEKSIIESIIGGEILSELTSLSFGLQKYTLMKFVDLLEFHAQQGLTAGTNGGLYVRGHIDKAEAYPALIEHAQLRVKQINAQYGTKFNLGTA